MVVLVGWTVYGLADYNNYNLAIHDPAHYTTYSVSVAVIYGALNRTAWACCLAWVVFACQVGYGGIINSTLSWKAFIPLGRLTYCGYLVSIPLQIIVRAQVHVPIYISDYKMVYTLVGDIVLTLIVSIIFSICFESPFIVVGKFIIELLSGKRKKLLVRI